MLKAKVITNTKYNYSLGQEDLDNGQMDMAPSSKHIPREVCAKIPKVTCTKVAKQIPRQACQSVSVPKCKAVTRQVPRQIPQKQCRQVRISM